MKKIKTMNYLKKALERRLRAKIALKANYSISDAHAVYEFVKNGTPMVNSMGFSTKQVCSEGTLSAQGISPNFVVTDKNSTRAKLDATCQ